MRRIRYMLPAILLLAPPSQALMTFQFQGVVDQVTDANNLLAGGIVPGTTFSGSYSFDPLAIDQNANPTSGVYATTPPFVLNIGTLSLSGVGTGVIVVEKPNLAVHSYSVGTGSIATPQFIIAEMGFRLTDSFGSYFSSDHLPTTPPPLNRFDLRRFEMIGYDSSSSFTVSGDVFALTPEPGGCLLLCAAGCLAFRRKRVFRVAGLAPLFLSFLPGYRSLRYARQTRWKVA